MLLAVWKVGVNDEIGDVRVVVDLRRAVHRTIVLVDVEGFGDRRRTNVHQVAVRRAVYSVLRKAIGRAGISWARCDREDRGDGVFVLVPGRVAKGRLVEGLFDELVKGLRQHNERCAREERIRLRMALHAGEVIYDNHGVTGAAINFAFRLLDSEPVKAALAGSSGLLAVVASDWFFDEVIRHSAQADLSHYRRVRVAVKETIATAWVHLPDSLAVEPVDVRRLSDRVMVPRQLPLAVRDFVGRDRELQALDSLLDREDAVGVAALDGAPGVGKTTLAIHWAHRVQRLFPDGTLFANLRGHGPSSPLDSSVAVASFLHVLGVPNERVPDDLDTQAGMYRSILAGRRMLIVLDNAATAEQVRPLLPGTPGSFVLVTSRATLTGLTVGEAAHRITLGLFTEAEADDFVRRIIGDGKAAAEPDSVAGLIVACARLPLALRVAATRAIGRHGGIAEVVEGITGSRDRLEVLSGTRDDHSAVRTVFGWSYARLTLEQARVFRRLGLHPGVEFGDHATAALIGLGPVAASRHLEALADMHLLVPVDRNRYRMHDLLHVFAGHRAELDDVAEDRRRAMVNLIAWYARTARRADALVFTGFPTVDIELDAIGSDPPLADRSAALAWLNAEQANLMSVLRSALQRRFHTAAICLAGAARFLALRERALWPIRLEAETQGLAAARAIGNTSMAALLLGFRGDTHVDLGRLVEAEADFEGTLVLGRQLDDPVRQRAALVGLGRVRLQQHRYQESLSYYQRALPLARRVRDERAEAVVHCNLSRIGVRLGQHGSALAHARQELVLRQRAGDWVGEAYALQDAASAWQGLGNHQAAADSAGRAIAMYRYLDGTEQYLAAALEIAANSWERVGDRMRAKGCLVEASEILTGFGDPRAEVLRNRLQRI